MSVAAPHQGRPATPPAGGGRGSGAAACLPAYTDPVIYRDDRVLRTLLRKESRYVPSGEALSSGITPAMRREVANWMLEVCEDQSAQPEVFCLAMNCFDRFLHRCAILRSQLQLLGAVCLLVSWKVREHEPLPAVRLVEYSDFNLTLLDIMEWEVLLLSKLDWDVSAVIASDFVEHIIQRVARLRGKDDGNRHEEMTRTAAALAVRRDAEALLTMCSAHHTFTSLPPSLVAAAAVLTTLRPDLDERLEEVLETVEHFSQIDKACIREAMGRIEALVQASLPPSPLPSPRGGRRKLDGGKEEAAGGQDEGGRNVEVVPEPPASSSEPQEETTPTKVLDVAKNH